ncbi:hydroxypyruvate reductase [Anaerotignum neopropionicum]|uniref:D-3-phosphoglycerate dehydrogenase n=1 Tax=Anaerotignum neopropionicum TaxID=36847 RepID=A0A136WHU5_9FIRM|nr:3-phosphoglycerate dehydrogenase family protein [Anaerotignum neopropionicum]KXL53950.1 hydroxypyruvate reductase [Anaerotignum neopropionicum]
MFTIRTLNNIASVGLAKLPKKHFTIDDTTATPDGIILRSFDMHNLELNDNLLAVARAGAGTNNVPIEKCSHMGIPVFNAPGGNANAVKELVLASLFISSRRIVAGSKWVQSIAASETLDKEIEAGKKNFVGPEILGKTLGVIGLGAIGVLVANAALDLGMDVVGYDPFLSLESAWHLSPSVEKADSMEDVVAKSDYITLHIPLSDKTRHTYNDDLFTKTKPGARLLNFARGGLVDTTALLAALEKGTIARYVTDFPEKEILGHENIIVTPHLGASTPESEENCAIMAAEALRDYLYFGNVKNSVNFPNCTIPYNGKPRIAVSHRNKVNMIGQLAAVFTKYSINIDKLVNNSKGELAYNIIVCDSLPENEDDFIRDLYAISNVIKVRLLK